MMPYMYHCSYDPSFHTAGPSEIYTTLDNSLQVSVGYVRWWRVGLSLILSFTDRLLPRTHACKG